jgi:hypothetical protein
MLGRRHAGRNDALKYALLMVAASCIAGCGDDGPSNGTPGPLPDASADARSDANLDVSSGSDSSDAKDASAEIADGVDVDVGSPSDARPDGADDSTGDGSTDVDATLSDGGADTPQTPRPDGGPVTGPGCGGCFANEQPAGGLCIANISCGTPLNAVMRRVDGVCQIESCHPGWGDCDGRFDNGCEEDLTRPEGCNGCANACAQGQFCAGSAGCMSACAPPLTDCGGACVDLNTSPFHCGECFKACTDQQWHRPVCAAGVCGQQIVCGSGAVACGNVCSVIDEDPAHCGGCGQKCKVPAGGTTSCRAGVCVPHCPTGFTLCGDKCVDLQSDPGHCGACNDACSPGSCVGGSCDSSWSPIVATATSPSALAIDDTSLYWIETQAGRVMKVAKGGGTPVALATAQAPFDLALDATHVYWSSPTGNAIQRLSKAGGASPELVVSTREPMHIVTDGTFLYFEEAPLRGDAGTDAGNSGDAGPIPPLVVRKTRIGTGVSEDYWTFSDGESDVVFGRMLVDEHYFYWSGRHQTGPRRGFTFLIDKATGGTMRTLPSIWGEMAMDDAYLYITTGSGVAGAPLTVGAVTKLSSRGWGLMQFDPGPNYSGGASMTAGSVYLYRSSAGALTGVQKILKCGADNTPQKLAGTERWSFLVTDEVYVYGVFGDEIRRAPR